MPDESPPTNTPEGRAAAEWFERLHSPEVAPYWLSAIIESAQDAVISKSLEGVIMTWNQGAERVFGYTAEEIVGKPVTILIPADHVNEESAILARLRAGERIEHYETVRRRKDGALIDVSLTVSPIWDSGGRIVGASKVARDITQRRRAEGALRESEERYQKLVELSPDAIVVHSGGRVLFINTAGTRLLRATEPGQIVGRPVLDFVRPDYHQAVHERLRRLQEGGANSPAEMVFVRLDGTEVTGELMSAPVNYRGVPAVQAVVRDITGRKRAEEALREADRRALQEYERLLARITDLAQTFAAARELSEVFRALKEFALASVPGSGIFVSLYDPASRTRAPVYAWSEGEEVDVSGLPPMPMSDSPHSRAVSTGEVVITDDFQAAMEGKPVINVGVERDPRLPQSSLAVPMVEMGRVVGAVEVQSTEPAAYREGHAAAMRMAANLAAVAVENVRLLKEESRAREEAEASNRLKDEFLATLSHELRTPLTAIIGWSSMLRGNKFDEATVAGALETIERNARAQARIVEDLMDVSRIVTGKLRMDVQAVELAPVVAAAVDAIRLAAEAKGIELRAHLDPQAGPVSGDPARLQQVVWNLLTNAVKFTPEGGRVEARLGRAGAHVEVTVSDTGQGIREEFLPHVFDRFRQADQTYTRAHGGLGLGLSIVRHLVELHGGTVRAESAGEGHGATFTVLLPVTTARRQAASLGLGQPSAEGGAPSECPPSLAGLRVLVVDDEEDTRVILRAMLEQCGAEVMTASSAAEALELFEQSRPDVLVSDIGMPEEDGYALLGRVRGLEAGRAVSVPAVALTAYAGAEDRVRALRAGFQVHVPKPVEPAELAAVVASLAGRTGIS